MSDFATLAEETGLGAEELAEKLGVSYSTLWRYRNGKTKRLDAAVVDRLRSLRSQLAAPAPFEAPAAAAS